MRADHARQAMLLGKAHKFMHAIRRFVGQADVANLALLDQPGQRFKLIVYGQRGMLFFRVVVHGAKGWHMTLGPVNLIEVNHLGLQAPQAAFTGVDDVLR